MKKIDLLIALFCGLAVAWIAKDFLASLNTSGWLFFVVLPALSIAGLDITEKMGEQKPWIKQTGRFFLIGALAAVADIKFFELSEWAIGFFVITSPLISKTISFVLATASKYSASKYWTFNLPARAVTQEEQKININEFSLFFLVTFAGIILNLAVFYYFNEIMGPSFSISPKPWTTLSIIFSGLIAAIINFLGYKFIVFKK